jgi:hypothetical protein
MRNSIDNSIECGFHRIRKEGFKMNNRTIILEKINNARSDLLTALNLLIDENENGKQFDYVNSPRLSDSFDGVNRTVNKINKVIYNVGTRFRLHDKVYTITGSGQLGKKYFYNIKGEFGRAFSINRTELLEGIQDGLVLILG